MTNKKTFVRLPLGPKNCTITGRINVKVDGLVMFLRYEDVHHFRRAYDLLEAYRNEDSVAWIGIGYVAQLMSGQLLVDGGLYIDHATVASNGQVLLKLEAGRGKELCVHYQLEELEALAAAN